MPFVSFFILFAVIVALLLIAWIDQKTMEIPDWLNGTILGLGILATFCGDDFEWSERLIGACCVSVPMYLMNLVIEDAFGGGDIKLTIGMGWYLGWKMMLVGSFLACMFGGLQATYLLIFGKVTMGERTHMAFGPALCAGFIIALLYGEEILTWYLGLFLGG